ncbi:hypothetical protein CI105_02890 [Candidatus Izimaplasma bacterium ZiA1]|uniref:ABC transporter ATP-binding protein n=1 Tax=Candidatus Izimoplasma sp. ZiA1 TaxID=2024899 RepID=UPI000BAA9429|nr:hypothetical protein CI105_02890 [Candidatus Izimaplasma bacterium ZiA1]
MSSLMYLIKYAVKFKKQMVLSMLMMLIQVTVGFVIPLITANIIDVNFKEGNITGLIINSLLMLLVALVGLGASIINNYNSQYVAQYASAELRSDLFIKIQSLSFKNVDKFKTSRLITSSTNDVLRIQQFYQMLLRIIIRAPFMVIVGLILAISKSRELSSLYVITMPLLLISIVILIIIGVPRFKKVQKSLDNLNNVVLENAKAPRVIKSFVNLKHENSKFEEVNQDYRKINTAAEKVMAMAEPIILFIFNAGIAGILFLGAYYIGQGQLLDPADGAPLTGTLLAFNSFSMQILMGVMMFAMMMIFISRAEVSAKRIKEIMEEEVDLTNAYDAIKDMDFSGGIEFKNVSFGYGDNGNRVIKNISFKVKNGERIGIIGSTGSGKTSLVNLIPRLYDVCEGEVLIDNVNVKKIDLKLLRDQIGFVTQNPIIFSGSIATNIAQGKTTDSHIEFIEAAKKANAEDFINDYDDSYNHETMQKGSNLSGGQKQRLSLARAFIRKPKILILDDSTSAVDAKSEAEILNTIDEYTKNMTTLLISQKISTIKDLDKILVLNNQGEIDGFDTHNNLLKTSTVYKEIAESQMDVGGNHNE